MPLAAVDRRTSRVAGFTFVEILAALMFLGLVVPVILGALMTSNRTSLLAERGAIAGELAQNKLGEMLIANAWQASPSAKGDFGGDYPGYRWAVNAAGWTGDTVHPMTELDVDVFYTVQGHEFSNHLSTLVDPNAITTTPPASSPSLP